MINKMQFRFILLKRLALLAILLAFLFGALCFGYVLFMNLNQDKINLNDNSWKLIFSFITNKYNVKVSLYGRHGAKPNSGEFVIVRVGAVPFIKLVSPIYREDNVWETRPLYPAKGMGSGSIEELRVCMGYYASSIPNPKYWTTPSMCLSIYFNNVTKEYVFYFVDYVNCDVLPVFIILKNRRDFHDLKYNYICKQPKIYNEPLDVIPRR